MPDTDTQVLGLPSICPNIRWQRWLSIPVNLSSIGTVSTDTQALTQQHRYQHLDKNQLPQYFSSTGIHSKVSISRGQNATGSSSLHPQQSSLLQSPFQCSNTSVRMPLEAHKRCFKQITFQSLPTKPSCALSALWKPKTKFSIQRPYTKHSYASRDTQTFRYTAVKWKRKTQSKRWHHCPAFVCSQADRLSSHTHTHTGSCCCRRWWWPSQWWLLSCLIVVDAVVVEAVVAVALSKIVVDGDCLRIIQIANNCLCCIMLNLPQLTYLSWKIKPYANCSCLRHTSRLFK